MIFSGIFRGKGNVIESWCSVAIFIHHQLHQQHAFVEIMRLRHAYTGCGQSIKGINFSTLPSLFLQFSTVLRTFFHRAGLTTILGLTAFCVIYTLSKTTLVSLFVNFSATYIIPTTDNINGGFFTAHQLANNIVNQAIFN